MAIADDHDKDLRISKYGTGHVRATSSRMARLYGGRGQQRNMKHACRVIGVSA